MITIEQCRAARGLLGWTQQDLADASGLSKTAINNFEKKHSEIKVESLKAIERAFEELDIEFLKNQGLRQHANHTRLFHGDRAFRTLIIDIMDTTPDKAQPLLISNLNNHTLQQLPLPILQEALTTLAARGVPTKIVYEEGVTPISGAKISTRTLSKQYSRLMPTCFTYGHKHAVQFFDHDFITITDSAQESARHRDKFSRIWDAAQDIDDQDMPAENFG